MRSTRLFRATAAVCLFSLLGCGDDTAPQVLKVTGGPQAPQNAPPPVEKGKAGNSSEDAPEGWINNK